MIDEQTVRCYDERASELAGRYESVVAGTPGLRWLWWGGPARVLDVGCGSGRDLAMLADLGCAVVGVEPSAAMRAEAERLHPSLRGRILVGHVGSLGDVGGSFDAVICAAVLMHLPAGHVEPALRSLRGVMVAGGRLLVSISTARADLDPDRRDYAGRLFAPVSVAECVRAADAVGLRLVAARFVGDSLGRASVRWATLLFLAS